MKILIVDDNPSMGKVLTALFVSAGHEVVGAMVDGSEVEARITELQPNLVCLDYNLPGKDGLAILAEIHAKSPEIDVIFMTASADAAVEKMAADAGAAGFIRKPFSQEQIIKELKDVEAAREKSAAGAENEEGKNARGGASAGVTNTKKTVVIADDNGSVRMLLKGLLEGCGLRVLKTVSNGTEAVNAAKAHQPSVLCLDVNMPEMGGMEALPLILQASPDTIVVMVTGCADREFVTQASEAGAKGYILKPLRPAYVEGFMKKLFP
ncbi:MAG: response regulator [Zoogloeaceae bacterium]|nr:response regulator [Zoogloeaceae bacterium]